MANFIVRVELRGHANYDALHSAMERAGFSRTIRDIAGTLFHLPRAEYFMEAYNTVSEIRDLAMRAATAVDPLNVVLVTEAASILNIAWNLEKV